MFIDHLVLQFKTPTATLVTAGRLQPTNRPSGQPRRQLDTSRANTLFGWMPKIDLEEGLRQTIDWWQQQLTSLQTANS